MKNNISPISGFLNIYKPPGPTSMDVLRQVKQNTGQRKRVGHGGTLDPQAEGVLPICFGQATRLMELLVDSGKEYRMEVRLGATTTTYDGEGDVVNTAPTSDLTLELVEDALEAFRGTIQQVPPMYSALKVEGKRLYKLARSGIEVERQPRDVEIHKLEILEFASPSLVLLAESGRGAYMRSLAHDLGQALGCGAYLSGLVRTRSGAFRSEDAITMEDIIGEARDEWQRHMYPVDYPLLDMKALTIGRDAERLLRAGQSVALSPSISAYVRYMERHRAYSQDGRFVGVLSFDLPKNRWLPHKLFSLDSPSPYAPNIQGVA